MRRREPAARVTGARPERLFLAFVGDLANTSGWRMPAVLALSLLASATEGVGFVVIIPLLHLVGVPLETGGIDRLAVWIGRLFERSGVQPSTAAVLALFMAVLVMRGLLARWAAVAAAGLEQDYTRRLRQRLHEAVLGAAWLPMSRHRRSDVVHVFTQEVNRVSETAEGTLRFLGTSASALVLLALACAVSPAVTAVVLASGAALLLFLRGRLREIRGIGEGRSVAERELYAAVAEQVAGLKDIKAHGHEAPHRERFDAAAEACARALKAAQGSYAMFSFWMSVGAGLLLSATVWFAVEAAGLSAAAILLLVVIFARVVPRITGAQAAFQFVLHSLPAYESVQRLLASARVEAEEPGRAPGRPLRLREEIRLESVSFSYPGTTAGIREVSLRIPAGRVTALVGPSGGGKTTVADLVAGLIAPDRGQVLVDGRPLAGAGVAAWRARLGYVTQEPFLHGGTVRENLEWRGAASAPGEIEEALALAGALGFVRRLPAGLDTPLGDGGSRLSGGERQRIALARALLRRPELLILDEATNALDAENEELVAGAVERLRGIATVLVIAHQPALVRRADLIHLIQDGGVVRSGTWEALAPAETGRVQPLAT